MDIKRKKKGTKIEKEDEKEAEAWEKIHPEVEVKTDIN